MQVLRKKGLAAASKKVRITATFPGGHGENMLCWKPVSWTPGHAACIGGPCWSSENSQLRGSDRGEDHKLVGSTPAIIISAVST